jgi:hypothetical protein
MVMKGDGAKALLTPDGPGQTSLYVLDEKARRWVGAWELAGDGHLGWPSARFATSPGLRATRAVEWGSCWACFLASARRAACGCGDAAVFPRAGSPGGPP